MRERESVLEKLYSCWAGGETEVVWWFRGCRMEERANQRWRAAARTLLSAHKCWQNSHISLFFTFLSSPRFLSLLLGARPLNIYLPPATVTMAIFIHKRTPDTRSDIHTNHWSCSMQRSRHTHTHTGWALSLWLLIGSITEHNRLGTNNPPHNAV